MFDELKSRMNKFWNDDRTLAQTDPEFVELFSNFAYDEVVNEPGANHPDLDDSTRSMAILAALIGCQGLDDFELMVPVAFESGVSAVQVKEIVYQAVAYLGFGRVLPDVYLEVQHPCWSCNSNSSSANASAGVR